MPATSLLNDAHGLRTEYSSPSWLAMLRFTSVDEHPVRRPRDPCKARRRCAYSRVVRSVATQDAKASRARFERAMDGERS